MDRPGGLIFPRRDGSPGAGQTSTTGAGWYGTGSRQLHAASSERPANGLDGEGRNRTGDTTIFSRVLYQLSYLAVCQPVDGSGRLQQAAEAVRRCGRRPRSGAQTNLRTRTLEKATLSRAVRSEVAVVTTARLSTVGPEAAVTSSSKL